jgi:hypothetical protein
MMFRLVDSINFGSHISNLKVFKDKLYVTSENLLKVMDLEKMDICKEITLDGKINSIEFSFEKLF